MTLGRIGWLIGCAAALLAAGPAVAEYKWTFSFTTVNCGNYNCYGNTRNASSVTGGLANNSVVASAWADTGGENLGTVSNPTSGKIENAYLAAFGSNGLGVQNRDGETMPKPPGWSGNLDATEGASPEHSMDSNQRFEAIELYFTDKTKLTGVEIGWPSKSEGRDSDLFVMAYTGMGTPAPLDSGLTYSQLAGAGWTLVGNYADLAPASDAANGVTGAGRVSVNNGGQTAGGAIISSNYWLIGSYNPVLGTTCQDVSTGGKNDGCSTYTEYGKLLAVYGERTKGVPEPSALLLFGIAAAGMWATRRRRTA